MVPMPGVMVPRGDSAKGVTVPLEIPQLKKLLETESPSRPLWATVDKAPVLLLGGFTNNKVVLLSDSGFDDFLAVEVDIDSCWIGSLTCPWSEFSSTILDAIATESTLFIRQNQLVYYFTGNYSVLHVATRGSALWTRVLNRICVGKLVPVPFPHNGSEFVVAIGRGQQEADFFLGTVRGWGRWGRRRGPRVTPRVTSRVPAPTDGLVHFSDAIRAPPPRVTSHVPAPTDGLVHFSDAIRADGKTVCEYLECERVPACHRRVTPSHGDNSPAVPTVTTSCKIQWAIYIPEENKTLLLLERAEDNVTAYHVVACHHDTPRFTIAYNIPLFRPKSERWHQGGGPGVTVPPVSPAVPAAMEKAFVMLVGLEEYSRTPVVVRGLSYNPFSTIFYAWGNVILQRSVIKNFIQSYRGEIVCVTEAEEVWFFMEGSSVIEQLFPSRAWSMFANIQLLEGSMEYGANESTLSYFYDREGLQQILRVLRILHILRIPNIPWIPHILWIPWIPHILHILQIPLWIPWIPHIPHVLRIPRILWILRLLHVPWLVYIPDGAGRIVKRKFPVAYVLSHLCLRSHHYSSSSTPELRFVGFTTVCPFAVLKFSELPMPQRYSRLEHYRAAPPVVTDRTGLRQDYYLYLASTGSSPGGLYVNMEHYAKIYDLPSRNELPERIYLDKGDAYSFSVTLSIRSTLERAWEKNFLNRVKLTVVLSHPSNLVFFLHRQNLVNRASVLYKDHRIIEFLLLAFQVSIQDTARYPQQGFSGKNLLKSSMVLKVVNSATICYQYSESGPALQGYHSVPVFIGCPPGKRMAFDITNSIKHTTSTNKRYFNCLSQNPEMPCFFFEDGGDAVIGGSAHSEDTIVRSRPEDVWKYNIDNARYRRERPGIPRASRERPGIPRVSWDPVNIPRPGIPRVSHEHPRIPQASRDPVSILQASRDPASVLGSRECPVSIPGYHRRPGIPRVSHEHPRIPQASRDPVSILQASRDPASVLGSRECPVSIPGYHRRPGIPRVSHEHPRIPQASRDPVSILQASRDPASVLGSRECPVSIPGYHRRPGIPRVSHEHPRIPQASRDPVSILQASRDPASVLGSRECPVSIPGYHRRPGIPRVSHEHPRIPQASRDPVSILQASRDPASVLGSRECPVSIPGYHRRPGIPRVSHEHPRIPQASRDPVSILQASRDPASVLGSRECPVSIPGYHRRPGIPRVSHEHPRIPQASRDPVSILQASRDPASVLGSLSREHVPSVPVSPPPPRRDVDTSTYCDYNLEFVLHVHGLQLSSTSKLRFMK
ncbi:PREDICTED: cation channel sperm-associated protein subunit gamma, partial [Tinamus guttatus]|uniref:cation channel sperm-associated protein subunit gamma n=1 Tax=Tinamus guttatus TaxID=94827 RepID=UPI00052E93B2